MAFDGGIDALSDSTRERLNDLEIGISAKQRQKGVADLRVLIEAYERSESDDAMLEVADFTILADPDGEDRCYLSVDAPHPAVTALVAGAFISAAGNPMTRLMSSAQQRGILSFTVTARRRPPPLRSLSC